MLRKLTFAILAIFIVSAQYSLAQSFKEYERQMNARFGAFQTQADKQYEDFYREVNARYADFMRREWIQVKEQPAIPAPAPNPPVPPKFDPQAPVLPQAELPLSEIRRPVVTPKPTPVRPIPVETQPDNTIVFTFFGAECEVRGDEDDFTTKMSDCKEASVAKYWQLLSDGRTNALINDCLTLREELQLCDWAYYQLAKNISAKIYGDDTCNEAIVMQTYILTQSGYKVRIGRTEEELRVLLSSDSTIYSTTYLYIGGVQFYLLQGTKGKPVFICDFEFPGESIFSMKIDKLPKLPVNEIAGRELQAHKYTNTKVHIKHNQNIIDFLNTFPLCSIDNYTTASLDDEAKKILYPVLQAAINNMPEDVTANILINFVQTAFEYKVDGEQFGRERTLFANETLYYPYSDCEDRALLFATLVRELMGLDVVLLDYPDHIATAVHFTQDIQGDYMTIDGKKYLICDPTYVGANIGKCMPSYMEVAAGIIKIE